MHSLNARHRQNLRALRILMGLAIVITAALFGHAAWDSRRKALEAAAEHGRQMVAVLHEHALKVLNAHQLVLKQADHWVYGRDWRAIREDRRLQRSLHAIAEDAAEVSSIWLTDASGRIQLGSVDLDETIDASTREYFLAQRDQDAGTYVTAPYVGRVSKRSAFAVSRRRSTEAGDFDGVIHATVQSRYFETFWQSIISDLDPVVVMVRSDGAILARTSAGRAPPIGAVAADAPAMQQLRSAESGKGLLLVSPVDGTVRINAYQKLTGYPVYVVYGVGRDAVLARWRRDLAYQAVFAFAAIGSLSWLGILALRRAAAQGQAEIALRKNQTELVISKKRAEAAEAAARKAHTRLTQAIETMPQGLVLFDAEDRLVLCNSRYREIYANSADLFAAGASFEEMLRASARRGEYASATGREEEWVNDRLERHRAIAATFEQQLSNGRWLRIEERRLTSGDHVGLRFDITELKEREASFRLLFENNPLPMWVHDRETRRFLAVNQAALAQYGYSEQQFLAMTTFDIRPAEERERHLAFIATALKDSGRYGTWRHTRADGAEILVDVASHALPFQGTRAALVVAVDVTEQRRTEAALRESEARYRLAARASGSAIWDSDLISREVHYVGPMKELFGYDDQDVERRAEWWEERIHAKERDAVVSSLAKTVAEGGSCWEAEYRFRRADGSYAAVLDRAYTMRNEEGRPSRMVGAMLDVTRYKEVTEALRRSEAHLARAQQVASVGSFEYDAKSGELSWSEETYRIYGVKRELFTPTPLAIRQMRHADDRDAVPDLTEIVRWRRPSFDELSSEYRIVRPDGEVRWARRVCDLVFNALGEIVTIIGTIQDVTMERNEGARRRELELQLMHAQKLDSLGTLAGGIAHDLNNSLTPIIALSKLVEAKLPEKSRERRNVEVIWQAGIRARDLVRQILAFSRRETPKVEAVDLACLAEEAVQMLRATIPATIRIELATADVPLVPADPVQMHQVVVNLVTNAAHAIGERLGTITVSVSLADHGSAALLSVTDDGCGMDAQTQARIFDPFFTTKPVGEGTGLGLAVVHGIVSSHGGRIDVTSESGRGTTMQIRLPTAKAGKYVARADAA